MTQEELCEYNATETLTAPGNGTSWDVPPGSTVVGAELIPSAGGQEGLSLQWTG